MMTDWERGDLSRRGFLAAAGVAGGSLALARGVEPGKPEGAVAKSAGDVAVLPRGPVRAALALPHFPSRLHAFVWRNWPLVTPERMAETVGAKASEITGLGAAMGLGKPPRITPEQRRRGYLTVIRRNWHLLPYDQLLVLLGWTAEELAYTLREDDFFWIKLGSLKPVCEPLRWPPTVGDGDLGARREAAIADVLEAELGDDPAGRKGEAPFAFVEALTRAPEGAAGASPGAEARGGGGGLRFCYSYFALYGDPLLEPDLDPYPDGYLARLAEAGVTGVWLQAVLYRLAPFPWQPGLADRHEERRRNLAALVARAKRRGIRVFLYLNEPRAMPLAFFAERPELKGATQGDHAALCTGVPGVREYLAESVATIVRSVPDLGGFFTITASENFTNCWSHGGGATCPRCASRAASEVVAEVNACVQRGIERGGGGGGRHGVGPELLAWDWGWNDAWAADAIARLPAGVSLMSVSEWSLPIERGGVKATVGEYSLSAIGPGPRATRHWKLARERGLKTVAKIQAGNTWELSSLPYLPVLANVAEHARRLRGEGLDGIMLGWTLGGYPSPNLDTVAEVMAGGTLEDVARRRFGDRLGPVVLATWTAYSAAFREFPFDGGVVYSAPLQTGPANLLWAKPTGYAASMVGIPYDHLDGWRGPYPAAVFVGQFEKMAAGFDLAADGLARVAGDASERVDREHRRAALREADLGRAVAVCYRSVANQARFVMGRDRLGTVAGAEREGVLDELERVIRSELGLAKALHALQVRDSRVGFEASNHYFYLPVDLAEKVLNCRWLLDVWLPGARAAGGNR
jgi:hypothetical protein